MLPAPPYIVHCPQCNEKFAQPQLLSGNTFGETVWTDTKREAPMLPEYPDLVRCPSCKSLAFVSAAREADDQSESSDVPWRIEPKLNDWLDALALQMWSNPEDERYLRIHAWHAANDAWRPRPDQEDALSPTLSQYTSADEANLRNLIRLLEEEDSIESPLMRAEILRELGEFDSALALLKSITDPQLEWACKLIQGLAERHIALVQIMKFD